MSVGTPRLTGVYYNGPKGIKSSSARDLWTQTAGPWLRLYHCDRFNQKIFLASRDKLFSCTVLTLRALFVLNQSVVGP